MVRQIGRFIKVSCETVYVQVRMSRKYSAFRENIMSGVFIVFFIACRLADGVYIQEF
jgi:hypothetical protein